MLEFPETKTSLLLRLQNPRDEEAWREFVAIYRPVVYRLARMRELQHADADDLSQRVVIAVQRVIGNWRVDPAKGRFRFWLARIAQNAILNALSRRPPDVPVGGSSIQELLEKHPVPDPDTQHELEARIPPQSLPLGRAKDHARVSRRHVGGILAHNSRGSERGRGRARAGKKHGGDLHGAEPRHAAPEGGNPTELLRLEAISHAKRTSMLRP